MAGDHDDHGEVVTMDPRSSLKVYPRKDNYFHGKKSLNFDMIKSKVFVERKRD